MMNFEDITLKIEQINSIAYALEGAMIEAEGHGPDDKEAKQMRNLFYALFDQLEQLQKDADELHGHITVCNAIFAVNHVNELKAELAQLKQNA